MIQHLYIVQTTYHFIASFAIINDNIQRKNIKSTIFIRDSLQHLIAPGAHLIAENCIIDCYNENDKKTLVDRVINQHFEKYYFFQENDVVLKYIADHLKKNCATQVILAPDGTKPYGIYNKKHEFLSNLRNSLHDFLELRRLGVSGWKWFYAQHYKYGQSRFIDQLMVQDVALFKQFMYHNSDKIIELPSIDDFVIRRLMDQLNYSLQDLQHHDQTIFYFNQPFYSSALNAKEIEILSILEKSERPVYLKLHPNTSQKQKSAIGHFKKLQIIESKAPAEFYLSQIKNSIVLSGWSASMIQNLGSNNQYYYLFPLYKTVKDDFISQINFVCFDHISQINSLNALIQIVEK